MPTCNAFSTWCSTDTTSATDIWIDWNGTTSATTSATTNTSNNTIWMSWTSTSTEIITSATDTTHVATSQESLERGRVAEHARCQAKADAKVAEEDRIAARKRAMKLLLSNLTKKQKEQFAKHKFFVIEGGKSKRKYRIRGNPENASIPMANIDVLHHDNDNNVDHKICFHLSYGIPLGDQLLAQKLMLENDEDRAIEVSNRHAA